MRRNVFIALERLRQQQKRKKISQAITKERRKGGQKTSLSVNYACTDVNYYYYNIYILTRRFWLSHQKTII